MKTRQKLIYTYRMAQSLIAQGFTPVAQAPNAFDMTKTVWLFDDTPELETACAEYIAESERAKEKRKKAEQAAHMPIVSDEELSDLYLRCGQSIENIARLYGVPRLRVRNAIMQNKAVKRAFAYALMTADERAVADAVPQNERERMFEQKLISTDYDMYCSSGFFPFRKDGLQWEG